MRSRNRSKIHRHARLRSEPNVPTTPEREDCQNQSAPSWRALFFFTTRSHIPALTFAIFFSIASGAANPAQSFIIGKLFNGFTSYATHSIDKAQLLHHESKYTLYMTILAGATWLIRFLEFTSWLAFGELQAISARLRLFDSLLDKDLSWYETHNSETDDANGGGSSNTSPSTPLTRTHSQIRDLQLATAQPLGTLFTMSSTALLSLTQALIYSWDLTLVTISTVPLILALVVWIGRGLQQNIEKHREELDSAQRISGNAIRAIETVKSFRGQRVEAELYGRHVDRAGKWYTLIARANAAQMGLFVLLSVSIFVQGFYYGSVLVAKGKRDAGQVITTFLSAVDAFQAVQNVLPQMLVLEKGRAAGRGLRGVMAEGRERAKRGAEFEPKECKGEVDVRNVSFAYPGRPERLVLENVSLYIPGGEMTFLIGKSGSGKSTIGQLLLRLYPLQSGRITLDGYSLVNLRPRWLRSKITLVEQLGVLFDDTISQNIAFGHQDSKNVGETEITAAAEFALLKVMILDLREGLETQVGQRGTALSGGQRQRIALARAKLRDTPILILDESTSALDQTNRTLMMEAIRKWRSGRTTIVITHDISQIEPNDYVFMLENGKLVEEGYRKYLEKLASTPFRSFLNQEGDTETENGLELIVRGRTLKLGHTNTSRDSSAKSGMSFARLKSSSPSKRNTMLNAYLKGSPLIPNYASTQGIRSPKIASPLQQTLSMDPSSWAIDFNSLDETEKSDLPNGSIRSSARRSSIGLENLVNSAGEVAVRSRSIATVHPRLPIEDPESQKQDTKWKISKFINRESKANSAIHQVHSIRQVLFTVWPSLNSFSRVRLIAGLWASTVHAAASPVFAYTLSKLLDTYATPGGNKRKALIYSMGILSVAVIDAVHMYLLRFLLECVSQSWVDHTRKTAFGRVLHQPIEFFERKENTASLLSASLDRNAEEMRNLLGRFAAFIYVVVMLCTISIVWALIIQWKLTLVALAVGPFIYGVSIAFAQISRKWERLCNDAAEIAGVISAEVFANIKTVKALTLEPHFREKYAKASRHALRVGLKRSLYVGFFYGLSDSAGDFSIALIFYVGTRLVLDFDVTVNTVIQVFSILMITIANVSAILSFIPQIENSLDTATRLLRLAQGPLAPTSSPPHDSPVTTTTENAITISNISFSYPSSASREILSNLTLTISKGTSIAIAGPSGAGKSTLASLLLGLHKPTSGTISFPRPHSRVASVHQSPFLFPHRTIAENISYPFPPNNPRNDPQVISAAKRAKIHEFILSLPQAYQTLIPDEEGSGFSGGQVSRLALARALFGDPEVLVVDEVTGSLDPGTAGEVRGSIWGLVTSSDEHGEGKGRGVTVVAITHDVEMMRGAGRVAVVEGGRVVEDGGFEELMGREGGRLRGLMTGGLG